MLVEVFLLTLERLLNPDFSGNSEMSLQFDDLNRVGNIWPVMMPAHNHITLALIMTVRLETACSELELDSGLLLRVAHSPVGNAVRELGAYLLNAELETAGDMREKKHDTEFIGRCVFHRRVLQGNWLVLFAHFSFCPTQKLTGAAALCRVPLKRFVGAD